VGLLTAGAAGLAVPALARGESGATAPRSLVKPPRLKEGAVVGLIAPGGVVDDALIEKCVRNLEALGFKGRPGANIRAARGGYAGSVEQRLDDFHAMFRDREIEAVWAARGGSGCLALLPRIDYAAIRRSPKILIGYSDITALHLALHRHAGVVTFHGPVASSTFSEFSVSRMRAVLMEPRPRLVLPIAPENLERAAEEAQFAPHVFRAGRAEGRLVGGNLSTVCAMIGTPYAPLVKGNLLFLEEVGEAPYRIDRMLTQLAQAGVLAQASGVVLGVFQKCDAAPGEASLTLAQVLEDNLAGLRVPSAYGFSFGHIAQQITLPVGVMARFDTEARTLTLLEPAVA
jgi:muramoyltetrapeptide carboxypeptidase